MVKPDFFSIDDVELFIFDFDGVLTDNTVLTDENGRESVACSRADGLAFEALRRLGKNVFILSSELNSVVEARSKKLNVTAVTGVTAKDSYLLNLVSKTQSDLKKTIYIGNDINDYKAMKLCGYSACPHDSHPKIKQIADITLEAKGGFGVARELLESAFNLDLLDILYLKEN